MPPEQRAVSRRRRPASQVATAALVLGVCTALAGMATWQVASDGRLLLVLGIVDGETLAPLLWLVTSVCAVVFGVTGFRLYAALHELDRTAGNQVVIEDTGSTYGPTWRFYIGGPFVFDEIPASSITSAACAKLGTGAQTVSFADGEYRLTTDERGRDVLIFTTDGFRSCDGYGMNELVLPD